MPEAEDWIAARTTEVVTVRAEQTVAEAAKQMRDHNVGSLVVVGSAGEVVGIVTERDIIARSASSSARPEETQVGQVMTASPVCCPPGTPAGEANRIMVSYGIRHLPIVENGKPVGMISSRDVLSHQLRVNKAMKAVAERVAMMGKSFKSLDLEEVLGVLVSDVPHIFQADRCVLCFADEHAQTGQGPQEPLNHVELPVADQPATNRRLATPCQPIVRGVNCPRCQKGLAGRDDATLQTGPQVFTGELPPTCSHLGAAGPRLVIVLSDDQAGGCEGPEQGFLCMCGLPPGSTISEELLQYKAELIRNVLNVYLINAKLYRDARRSTLVDALTGLPSRKALNERLAVEQERAARYGRPFSVIIIDVDRFKDVSDRHGHAAGDELLRRLAEILRTNTRPTDLPARYGGDEFVLLMPETRLDQALAAAERIRCRTQEELADPQGALTAVSCGVAEWSAPKDANVEALLARADGALYQAKRSGRNRVSAVAAGGGAAVLAG